MYVTIENFDSETKKQRNHSNRILLKLIFIFKKSERVIKSEIYHIALFIMLIRKSSKLYIENKKRINILISAIVKRYVKINLSMKCVDDQIR